jgi:DNA-binding response OmpR family regulator
VHSSNLKGLPEAECSDLRGVRVLVVEDAWHLATTLKVLLETLGIEVVGPAATIFEAEHLAAARMPEVAVVDLNLKGEMAYGLINQLHDDGVPVIVVSGYAVPRLTEKAAVILQKPFNGPDLVAALRQAVGWERGRPWNLSWPSSKPIVRRRRRRSGAMTDERATTVVLEILIWALEASAEAGASDRQIGQVMGWLAAAALSAPGASAAEIREMREMAAELLEAAKLLEQAR